MGLFQVMPYHFEDGENAYLPETNAARGLAYLQLALDTYDGDYSLAFAAYNGGISNAGKNHTLWSAEMIRYVYWGENIYRDASQGRSHSRYLEEWLSSGGASLCGQARQHLG
jgi:soluble lytic murein transglycosylase-like protein